MRNFETMANMAKLIPQLTYSQPTGQRVSLFIPLHSGRQYRSVRVRIRKLLAQAEQLLVQNNDPSTAKEYLQPIEDCLADIRMIEGARGIALFRSNDQFFQYQLSQTPPELVVVADSFHIKPLLHCLSTPKTCHVVVCSQRQIDVYECSMNDLKHIGMYSPYDDDRFGRAYHIVSQMKQRKQVTDRFIRSACRQILAEFQLSHLALVGPKTLRKKVLEELGMRNKLVYENNSFASKGKMRAAISQALSDRSMVVSNQIAKDTIKNSEPGLLSNNLVEIAQAAAQGRIKKLLIDPKVQVWGVFDRERGLVKTYQHQKSDRDDCVIDDITEEVLRKGGSVEFFESTRLGEVAPYMAVLRW